MEKKSIDDLKKDLLDLGWRIRVCDKLISTLVDENLKDFYNKELLGLIDDYYRLELLLKKELASYIANETDNVIDFNMRKLKKTMDTK